MVEKNIVKLFATEFLPEINIIKNLIKYNASVNINNSSNASILKIFIYKLNLVSDVFRPQFINPKISPNFLNIGDLSRNVLSKNDLNLNIKNIIELILKNGASTVNVYEIPLCINHLIQFKDIKLAYLLIENLNPIFKYILKKSIEKIEDKSEYSEIKSRLIKFYELLIGRSKYKQKLISNLLISRKKCPNSLFYEDNLPFDLFKDLFINYLLLK